MPTDLDADPARASGLCQAAHARLLTTARQVTDEQVRSPSLLPGWTIGHVFTHLARNADGHTRRLEGALRGPAATNSAEFLGVQTMRSMVNYELASRFGMPYLAAAVRSPVLCQIIRENHDRQMVIDRLIQALGPPPAKAAVDSDGPYAVEYNAPFILGLALERMRAPGDYWDIIAEYRERFGPLRERLRKDRAQWDGRAGPYVRQLLQHVADGSRAMLEGEQATVGAGAAAVAGVLGGVAGASASLGIKLISLLHPAERARRCYNRWFRPELYLLTSLRGEAERLRALDTRVEAIWGSRWDQSAYRELDMLRAVNPAPFLKLGRLQ